MGFNRGDKGDGNFRRAREGREMGEAAADGVDVPSAAIGAEAVASGGDAGSPKLPPLSAARLAYIEKLSKPRQISTEHTKPRRRLPSKKPPRSQLRSSESNSSLPMIGARGSATSSSTLVASSSTPQLPSKH